MSEITLPWPPKELSPNFRSRSHWPRARATKNAKEFAYFATLEILPPCFKHNGSRMAFHVIAHPPTRHERDDDNLIASLKPYRDGIAKAMRCDDKLFDQQPIEWGEPVKNGRVVVRIA
jgi:crossover junction endodeoxyribonuclease RusA